MLYWNVRQRWYFSIYNRLCAVFVFLLFSCIMHFFSHKSSAHYSHGVCNIDRVLHIHTSHHITMSHNENNCKYRPPKPAGCKFNERYVLRALTAFIYNISLYREWCHWKLICSNHVCNFRSLTVLDWVTAYFTTILRGGTRWYCFDSSIKLTAFIWRKK